ncbi:MAG: glycoside hydrolase family 2 protein, partial [Clostridia bacterium]|nr:glycoside hydrolase family 2 protein [Clostridia bacterium]
GCKAVFKVNYAPGTLTAAVYDASGREIGRCALESASGETRITADAEKKTAKPGEVVYVPVTITGENGVVESNADRKLRVTVENGELLGFGSANPRTEERFDAGEYTTYYGRALAVVRVGESGKTGISATDGKETAKAEITAEA